MLTNCLTPWYNPYSWLGVKHQITYLLTYSISVQQTAVWSVIIIIISLDKVLKFLMLFSDPDQPDISRLWKCRQMQCRQNNKTLSRKITDSFANVWMAADKHDWCYKWFWSCLPRWTATCLYTPSRTIRSSSDTRILKIQQHKRKTRDFRTFSCFGPHIWNSLPQDLRHCSTL